MTDVIKKAVAMRCAPALLAASALWIGAQTLAARADSEDSRLFYAQPGPGAASLGDPAPPAAPAPADAPETSAAAPPPAKPVRVVARKTVHPHHRMIATAEHKPVARESRLRHAMHRPNSQIQ
jgi:hypothetical protein